MPQTWSNWKFLCDWLSCIALNLNLAVTTFLLIQRVKSAVRAWWHLIQGFSWKVERRDNNYGSHGQTSKSPGMQCFMYCQTPLFSGGQKPTQKFPKMLIPSTRTPSKKILKDLKTGLILSPQRSRLNTENVNMLTFLHHNQQWKNKAWKYLCCTVQFSSSFAQSIVGLKTFDIHLFKTMTLAWMWPLGFSGLSFAKYICPIELNWYLSSHYFWPGHM